MYIQQELWHLSSESEDADLVLASKAGYTTTYSDGYSEGEYAVGAYKLEVNDYRPAGGAFRVGVSKRVLDPLTSKLTWQAVVTTVTSYAPIVEVSSDATPRKVFTY